MTGFATNNQFGLGITEDKTVFKVFKKFFVSLNLPYSVKRGEAVLLQIVVFNYLPENVTTKVTLDNSLKQFEFVDPNTQAYKDKGCPLAIDASRSKTVTVNANDGVSLSFLITPLIIGPMLIKVAATSSVAGDAMEVPLLVVAEGVTQYKNKAQFVDLRINKTFITDLTVDVPKNAVADSTKVRVSAIGRLFQFLKKKEEKAEDNDCYMRREFQVMSWARLYRISTVSFKCHAAVESKRCWVNFVKLNEMAVSLIDSKKKTIDNRSSARRCHLRLLGKSEPTNSGFKDEIVELHASRLSGRIGLQTQ